MNRDPRSAVPGRRRPLPRFPGVPKQPKWQARTRPLRAGFLSVDSHFFVGLSRKGSLANRAATTPKAHARAGASSRRSSASTPSTLAGKRIPVEAAWPPHAQAKARWRTTASSCSDELLKFERPVLGALRQLLDDRVVEVARAVGARGRLASLRSRHLSAGGVSFADHERGCLAEGQLPTVSHCFLELRVAELCSDQCEGVVPLLLHP